MATKNVENIEYVSEGSNASDIISHSGSQENIQNPWPYLSDHIAFKSRSGGKLVYECKLCLPKRTIIKAHVSSLNNLKQHMKRIHGYKYVHCQFKEKVKSGSIHAKRKSISSAVDSDIDSCRSDSLSPLSANKRLCQQSVGESFDIIVTGSSITQASVDRCIVNFFVTNMIPLHVVESDTFVKLIKTLNPSMNSMSRRTLGRRIVDSHAKLKQYLISVLDNIDWLATTADCWYAHNKSFLGMTVHWIDPVTRARMHATLGCMRIKGVLSYDVLAQMMVDIHYEFHIEKKVTRTTIDNGSNFVKAFGQFGIEANSSPDLPSTSRHDVNSDTDDAIAALLSESAHGEELEYIPLENMLSIHDPSNTYEDAIIQNRDLPVQMRCAAHTFHLIVCKDIGAALQPHVFTTLYRAAMVKARDIWNLQAHSTVASGYIESELGRKLVLPNNTTWYSTYDAVAVLSTILETKRPALHRVMTQMNLQPFNDQDVVTMKEYVKIMSPVAKAVDLIQSKAQAYLGTLLPIIATTVFKLQNLTPLLHCCIPLADALLYGIKNRFAQLMEDEECLLAAAFHPKFRLLWLQKYDCSKLSKVINLMEAKVEDALYREREANEKDISMSGSSNNEVEEEEDFFSTITKSDRSKSLKNKAQNLVRTWLDSTSKHSFTDADFLGESVLINLFIRYNTAIPSSAAVEHLFSSGKDIFRGKRSSLSDDNFNMLMFMKGNMHLMQNYDE